MPEVFIAKVAEFPDGDRRIIKHGAHDIGVFHWEGQFYAYANMCLHQRDILGGNALKLFNNEMNGQKLAKVA